MKEPWEWDEDDVARLIHDKVSESLTMEFKSCEALAKTDGKKKEISKDVSAFANSAGGTIIYGVTEDRHTHEVQAIDTGYDPSDISNEWLEQVINSNIQRRIEGVRFGTVPLNKSNPGKVLYIVCIPESNRAPHMAADRRFYKRFELQSVAMEEYEVRELLRRGTYPSREIVCAWRDDVINPLLVMLKREQESLSGVAWKWNRYRNHFQEFATIGDRSSFTGNQEDFLDHYPMIERAIRDHDAAFEAANAEGQRFYEALKATRYSSTPT